MAKRHATRRKFATIRTDNNLKLVLKPHRDLRDMAVRWSYLIRNRNHWSRSERQDILDKLQKDARIFEYSNDDYDKLLTCKVVEIEIPYSQERYQWELRVMPWEFLLTNLIPDRRGSPTIVRRLKCGRSNSRKRKPLDQFAFVKSAPNPLDKLFSFDKEQGLILDSVTSQSWANSTAFIDNPTLAELKDRVHRSAPSLIHITGVDNHQGGEMLSEKDTLVRDGFYLADEDSREPIAVEARQIAAALTSAPRKPVLVGVNMFNAASRIAPLTVAAGAGAVVSMQDIIDDSVAELFFAQLYRTWVAAPDNLLGAFQSTLAGLKKGGLLREGTGIVLWSRESLLPGAEPAKTPAATAAATRKSRMQPRKAAPGIAPAPIEPLSVPQIDLKDAIQITVDHHNKLNYSLLHNGRSPFKHLSLTSKSLEPIKDVVVRLTLFLDSAPIEQVTYVDLQPSGADLRGRFSLPLLSRQLRCFRESVVTNLKITVECQGRVIDDKNLVTRILPLCEWVDSDEERQWLPSFVQPQDPAVSKVLASAARHLRSLTGDPYAGFDGYQQVEGENNSENKAVDWQVESIWDALLHDFDLTYINPPPTYTNQSQRIRTPSEILSSGSGTCLDLSILLASCLEHIEIYPVLFLLNGHAFPGYWRRSEDQEKFLPVGKRALAESIANEYDAAESRGQLDDQHHDCSWMTLKKGYPRVVRAVGKHELVPIESVWLTTRSSFCDACNAGAENLVDRGEFECLLDLQLARANDVLPLPERD